MKKITLFIFLMIVSLGQAQSPAIGAPVPNPAAANVISMFSNAYTNVAVDTWKTDWSVATLENVVIDGNDTKKYSGLSFVGVETVGPNMINASAMTYFHVDVWTPNMTQFRIKLVDFGANGVYNGPGVGDDTEHEVIFDNPGQSQWISYHIPLANFTGLINKEHIAQLIFSGNPAGAGVVFIDNVYFTTEANTAVPTAPVVAAPTPTDNANTVISMFSNAYTNVPVDTWKTDWSVGVLEDLQIAGNDTKKYTALDFVGIETVGPNMINANLMNHFHIDVWTPNMTQIRIKLVDFGANGVFGGGDDSEHEIIFENPGQAQWISYDIPLANFTGLLNKEHIAQLILAGNPTGTSTLFIDNVYFSNQVILPTTPLTAAPTPPSMPAANVISMFSNAYTNVTVDTWLTVWSAGNLEDIQIAGNDTKKYTNVNFVGVETVGANQINASSMTYFHFDAWTPNMTQLRVKLVDFGADGVFGGSDNTEHEMVYENPVQGQWISYHIPLSDFTGLVNREHISQLIFSGNPSGGGTVFIDNVYFTTQALAVDDFKKTALRLYPNPVVESLTISADATIENVTVYNVLGQQVLYKNTSTQEVTLEMATLEAGIYIVRTTSNGKSQVAKIIKK